ncbi:MAG: NUDIX hydrolase [Patescibacteria group bacterium]
MDKKCDNKSVGVLVWQGDKLLLIERKKPPFGFAPPAGHIDDKGNYINAAKEELEEETGLVSIKLTLLVEGRKDNSCRRIGGSWHYWKVYDAEVKGELKPNEDETKQAGWYSKKQMEGLQKRADDYLNKKISESEWEISPGIEPVWKEWFKELDII